MDDEKQPEEAPEEIPEGAPEEGEPKKPEEAPSAPEEGKEEEPEKPEEEPKVPLSRLRKEVEKKEKASEGTAEEAKFSKETLKTMLGEIETEKKEQEKQEQQQLRKDLDGLHNLYGDFNENKLMKVAEHYGCYDKEDNVSWDRAMELYNTPGILQKVTGDSAPPTKKIPQGKREGIEPQKEAEDLSKFRDAKDIAGKEIEDLGR